MTYKAIVFGKTCELPARTLAVDELIQQVSELDGQYQSGALSRREAVQTMYRFVDAMAPGVLPDVDAVDTNELMKANMDIILAYEAPARKAAVEAQTAKARELLNQPEIQKLLTLAPLLNTKK